MDMKIAKGKSYILTVKNKKNRSSNNDEIARYNTAYRQNSPIPSTSRDNKMTKNKTQARNSQTLLVPNSRDKPKLKRNVGVLEGQKKNVKTNKNVNIISIMNVTATIDVNDTIGKNAEILHKSLRNSSMDKNNGDINFIEINGAESTKYLIVNNGTHTMFQPNKKPLGIYISTIPPNVKILTKNKTTMCVQQGENQNGQSKDFIPEQQIFSIAVITDPEVQSSVLSQLTSSNHRITNTVVQSREAGPRHPNETNPAIQSKAVGPNNDNNDSQPTNSNTQDLKNTSTDKFCSCMQQKNTETKCNDKSKNKIKSKAYSNSKHCPICMERLADKIAVSTRCGHIFCKPCIKTALKFAPKMCPTCRKKFTGSGYHKIFL